MRKAKSNNFMVKCDIFPFDIMVSLGQTDDQLKESLKKYTFAFTDKMKLKGNGLYVMGPNNESLIRTRFYPTTSHDFGTLQHEIFHAVSFILDRAGLKLKLRTSDETYAYMIGYITQQVYASAKK